MKKAGKEHSKEKPPSRSGILIKEKWPWIALFLALSAVHLTAASGEIGGNLGGDSVVYYFLAKAMATGQGYADIYMPGSPPHTRFPFMFPLLLAPFHLVAERPLYAMHVMVALLNGAAAVILGIFLARRTGKWLGLAFAALFGTIPVIYIQSLHLLSEPLYMAFAFVALLMVERYPAQKGQGTSIKALAVISIVALLAFLTRTAGVALILAVAIALFRERAKVLISKKSLPPWAVFLVMAAVLAAPWIIRNQAASGESSEYVGQFLSKDPYNPAAGTMGALDFSKRLMQNSEFYLPDLAGGAFAPAWELQALQVVWPLILVLVLAGLIRELWAGHTAAESFTILSLAIVLVWPFYDSRFLVPVIPLSCFYLVRGITWMPDMLLSGKSTVYVLAGVMALLLAFQLFSFSRLVMKRFEPDWMPERPVTIELKEEKHQWRRPAINWAKYHFPRSWKDEKTKDMKMLFTDYIIMNRMLKKLTPQDAVILSRKPMFTYFFSGRKSVPLYWSEEPAEQRQYLLEKEVDYILLGLDESVLEETLRERAMFTEAASLERGISRVLKVDRDMLARPKQKR
ncbi:MAG: hypothetical protein R6V10_09380 [bacterium]